MVDQINGMYAFNSNSEWKERGFHLRTPPFVILSYDPAGDGNDRDALVCQQREEWQKGETHDPDFAVEMKFRILMCERLPVDLEFPDKLTKLLAMHRKLLQWTTQGRISGHVICVESNGVGWGMTSALRSKIGNYVISYTTVSSSGEQPYGGGKVSMPRLAALDHLRIMMETFHTAITPDAPGAKELISELNSFVWRRPGRPEAMDGQHDDLVMAWAGGAWIGSRVIPPILRATAPRYRVGSVH